MNHEKNSSDHSHSHHSHRDDQKKDSLESLKNEILAEVKKRPARKLSWGTGLVTAVLVILTVLSITQAVQSASILNKLNGSNLKSSSNAPSNTVLPSSLESLPNMVGGC